jgi:ribosome recycling factor
MPWQRSRGTSRWGFPPVISELIDLVLEESTEKMVKAVARTRHEFSTIRTGRASSAFVEELPVEVYGVEATLKSVANFSVPEARMLVVSPYDKSTVNAIEKAIRNSDLGLNPSNDGVVIRLIFPALTEERRRELVKRVRSYAEDGKVAIRNVRRSARHDFDGLAKDGEATEDEVTRAEKELDRLTHAHEAEIEKALEHKEAELLEV